jgi:hypothetical protein
MGLLRGAIAMTKTNEEAIAKAKAKNNRPRWLIETWDISINSFIFLALTACLTSSLLQPLSDKNLTQVTEFAGSMVTNPAQSSRFVGQYASTLIKYLPGPTSDNFIGAYLSPGTAVLIYFSLYFLWACIYCFLALIAVEIGLFVFRLRSDRHD